MPKPRNPAKRPSASPMGTAERSTSTAASSSATRHGMSRAVHVMRCSKASATCPVGSITRVPINSHQVLPRIAPAVSPSAAASSGDTRVNRPSESLSQTKRQRGRSCARAITVAAPGPAGAGSASVGRDGSVPEPVAARGVSEPGPNGVTERAESTDPPGFAAASSDMPAGTEAASGVAVTGEDTGGPAGVWEDVVWDDVAEGFRQNVPDVKRNGFPAGRPRLPTAASRGSGPGGAPPRRSAERSARWARSGYGRRRLALPRPARG